MIHGHLLTFELEGQGLREDEIGRLMQEGLGKEVRGWTSQNGQIVKICLFHATFEQEASIIR